MRFQLRTLFLLVAVSAVLIVPLEMILRGPRSVLLGFDDSMQRKFVDIEVGESKSELELLFGDPWSTENYFSRTIDYRKSDFNSDQLS